MKLNFLCLLLKFALRRLAKKAYTACVKGTTFGAHFEGEIRERAAGTVVFVYYV